jgi:uncharacterized protein (DUF362 family)
MIRVSLVKGRMRYDNIVRALQLIQSDIDVSSKDRILLKPNLVHPGRRGAVTHVDAVRAVLDFLKQRGVGAIQIGEGSGTRDTIQAFRDTGYLELARYYDVEFVDLNDDGYVKVQTYDRDLQPLFLRVERTVVESTYRISICPPKTDDSFIVTLSLKNMLVGSLIWDEEGNDKKALHQGYRAMNTSLLELPGIVPPHLSVIDHFVGMEGDGPSSGKPVDLGMAIASCDFLAADSVALRIMGLNPCKVGYLNYCKEHGLGTGDLSEIQLLGSAIEECEYRFELPATYQEQLEWHLS